MREFPSRSSSILLTIATTLLVAFLPLIIIANCKGFYFDKFEKYEVYDNFKVKDKNYLNNQFEDILDYMNNKSGVELDNQFYSEEDILHMVDVRRWMLLLYTLVGISSTYILVNIFLYKFTFRTTNAFRSAGKFLASIAILLGFYGYVSFQSFFINFHEIAFFNNEYWLLDPATSNLIKFLPIEIFQEIFIFFIINSFIIGISLNIFAHFKDNSFLKNNEQ